MTTRTEVSHPDKALFPGGITKQDVADYYESVAERMLPYLRDRPLVMQRFPEGILQKGFYQKNAASYFPDWMQQVEVPKHGGTVNHVLCNDLDTLMYLVNLNTITFHTWLSRADRINYPDLMVFDLDPPKNTEIETIQTVALELRDLLLELGLNSYVQASGSQGFHIHVPIDRADEFEAVGEFAMDVAEALVARQPDHCTTEFHKKDRGGRIFIDTLRNAYAQTAVAPYSLRSKEGAPAATPLDWSELEEGTVRPDMFTLHDMAKRMRSDGAPWQDLMSHPQSLELPRQALRTLVSM